MPNDTVTFALSGSDDLSMEQFATAVRRFTNLLAALNQEFGDAKKIRWVLSDLEFGSASATARAVPAEEQLWSAVEERTRAYLEIGAALRSASPIPYAPSVQRNAILVRDLLSKTVDTIRFETAEDDVIIERQVEPQALPVTARGYAHGAVTGRVQALTNRGSLRFTVYDLLNDKAVSCYMEPGHEEQLRGIWGRTVSVEGFVRRDDRTGRPLAVRHVRTITPQPEPQQGAYRVARGAVPLQPQSLSATDAIRRGRDAD